MKQDQRRLADYLDDILQAIERIARYTADENVGSFLQNEMAQDAVVRNLEIIGEASHNIEIRFPEFAGDHPELPFSFAYQMRNAVAHGYFKVDLEMVWKTIESELPKFNQQVREALTDILE